jgi:hypothetical protein
VKDFEEFHASELILVSVPDAAVPQVLRELACAQIEFRGKSVVLSSASLASSELREFSERGAAIGSICPIPGFDDLRYLLEGDRLAVLHTRRLVEHRDRRAIVIERSLKPFYLAALTCTGSVLFAVLMAAAESLRHAGITPVVSASILEKQVARTVRSFVRAGRSAFPAAHEFSKQVSVLAEADPELAHYVEQSIRLAKRLLDNRKLTSAATMG